jgi:hypothetical protein
MVHLFTPVDPQTTLTIFGLRTIPHMNQYMFYYHTFGGIWVYYTIIGIANCSVAGAVAQYYWSPDKKKPMGSPVIESFGRVMKYHLGSILLGSLLITIVEMIRILLFQLQVLKSNLAKG